ncbi:MAG TPA: hypothetical protein VHP30_07075, partial [Ignavibacteriales bacterium]|nr:hypothetical protein [Ignavibacteriales bacterium]
MNQYSEEKIDFRKCRDLGELITVTFRFARQEGKSLLKPVFMYLAPILLVFLICLDSLYVFVFGGDKALYGEGIDQFLWMNLLNSFIAIIINLLVNFFTYSYIYSYIKGNGRVDFSLVKERMFRRFFPALGWIMIAGITIIFGLFFFIIPAIY